MSANAVTLADITSASWSLMLDSTAGAGPASGIGRVVQNLHDIDQCVRIILSTLPGEDPWRPTFGCDLTKFIDRLIPTVLPAIVATVTQAIERWEPRIKVLAVRAQADGAAAVGTIRVTVQWQIDLGAAVAPGSARVGALAPQTTTVTIR